MSATISSAFGQASEARRRSLPAAAAFIMLSGGVSAALLGETRAIGWAAAITAMLMIDVQIYRRFELRARSISAREENALCVWAFVVGLVFAGLPIALWLSGAAGGGAAALALWVVAALHAFGDGAWSRRVSIASAAPAVTALVLTPSVQALLTPANDWSGAVVTLIGGAGLIAFGLRRSRNNSAAEREVERDGALTNVHAAIGEMLFENDLFSALVVDREMRIVAFNDRVRRNWSLGDAVGRPLYEACPWLQESWRKVFESVIAGRALSASEQKIETPGGTRWMDWDARPWRDANGEIVGAVAFGRDRSDAVLARRASEEARERLNQALAASRSVAWELDFKNDTISWHGDPTPIYGAALEFSQFRGSLNPEIPDADRARVRDEFMACLSSERQSFEHRLLKADGRTVWVQLWVRGVPGRNGGTRRAIGLTIDITERKEQEQAFLSAMERAESAIRVKRAMLLDRDAKISVASAEPKPEGAGLASVQEMFQRLDSLLDEMDARDALLAETLDALRKARQSAEDASITKSRFLASMSHELRTPLNAIIGYSEILMEEAEADGRESDQKDIARVLASARQLLSLIGEILDLSKIEAGRVEVSISSFNVADLISEAVDTVLPAAFTAGNQVTFNADCEAGVSESDAFKLTQCLLNLLANACKFTKCGSVTVSARRKRQGSADWIEVDVADTGIGMSEEQITRLFQPYMQANAEIAQQFGGTGLGLAITRRMMQMLGGDVSVASVLGRGSTFTLRWPAVIKRIEPSGASVTLAEPVISGAPTVLIIDDEDNACDLVTRALGRAGLDVHAAKTGEEGLALARALKPALIFVDIELPDISGWEVLTELRADQALLGIPVVVHSIDDDRRRALSLGACEHLVKPADRDLLAAVALRFMRPVSASVGAENANASQPIISRRA